MNGTLAAAFLLTVPFMLAGSDVGAQASVSTARLREGVDSMQVRAAAADSAYRRALLQRRGAPDELVVAVQGVKIVAAAGTISPREREVLAGGVRQAFATLTNDFGTESVALVDTTKPWRVRRSPGTLGVLRTLWVTGFSGPAQATFRLSRPLSGSRLTSELLRLAGTRLPSLVPAIKTYAGANASFAADDDRFEMVARELALSDWPIASGCLNGDVDSCRQVLEPGTSLTISVRASFVTHALDVGGPQMLSRLIADTASDPMMLLARGARMPVDSLVAGWQRRTAVALERSRPPAGALVASTAAWGLLLLGFATSRKPS